jgi:hypothetical protein
VLKEIKNRLSRRSGGIPVGDEAELEDYPVAMKWRLKLLMALGKFRMRLAKLFR